MVTIRMTIPLMRGLKLLPDVFLNDHATTRLGDWYANRLRIAGPRFHILAVSEKTLLPVLFPYKDKRLLVKRLLPAVEEMLRAIGVPERKVAHEMAEMDDIAMDKTMSPTTTRAHQDFMRLLKLGGEQKDHLAYALSIVDAPHPLLGGKSPRQATLEAFRR